MRMNCDVRLALCESKRVRLALEQIVHERFEQQAPLRDFLRTGNFQLTIIFDKHRPARWLEKKNGRDACVMAREKIDIVPPQLGRIIQISLTERGSSTAFSVLHQLDFKSERFEHSDGRDSNVRFVVTNERIIP